MVDQENGLDIKEWEIWHTYTTYVFPTEIDLKKLADDLIQSELAHLAMLRDGYTVWRNGNAIGKGRSTIELTNSKKQSQISFDKEESTKIDIEGYAAEAWKQGCHFRFSEKRLFGPGYNIPPPYVRAFLGKCILSDDQFDQEVHLYPILTVYETGIMSVEMRSISPAHSISLRHFIDGAVNLYNISFKTVKVPPAISKLVSKGYMRTGERNIWNRSKLLKLEKKFDKLVNSETSISQDEEFEYSVSPLRTPLKIEKETLSTVSRTIFDAVAFLLSDPQEGMRFILRGLNPAVLFDGSWIGRPHIYLCDFKGQQDTSTENEEIFSNEFVKILMREPDFPAELHKDLLPEDVRMFEDYGLYLGPSGSLLAWSKEGVKQYEPWKDINRGHLIYEQQASMRMLDYVYMLYRRLLNQVDSFEDTQKVIMARKELSRFEQNLLEISSFGEIRELFSYGLEQLGIDEIKKRVQEGLELQRIENSDKETRTFRKIGIVLTVVFGISSIPAFSYQVLKPIWLFLALPYPKDETIFNVALLVLTSLVLVFVLWGILGSISGSKNKGEETNYFREK